MRVLTALAHRTAIALILGCVVAPPAWGAPSTDQTPKSPARSVPPARNGSCEDITARESSAYLARLKARDYAAASEIARRTADVCLDAGDLQRAKYWFQTARALGRQTDSTADHDEKWRRRYEQAAARVPPPQTDVASAEARLAERRTSDAKTSSQQLAASTASSPTSGDATAGLQTTDSLGFGRLSMITTAAGFGLFALGVAVLRRRNVAGVPRRDRDASNSRHRR